MPEAPTSLSQALGSSSAPVSPTSNGAAGTEGNTSGPPSTLKEALSRAAKTTPAEEFDPVKNNNEAKPGPRIEKEEPKPKPKTRFREARDPQQEPQQRQPDPAQAQKFRAKVMGQEREVSAQELLDYYQRGESANKKFQEAARKSKEAEERIQKMQQALKDPKSLVDMVIDDADGAKAIFEAYKQLEQLAKMTPEQQQEYLRVRELENRDLQLKRIEEERRTAEDREKENRVVDRHIDGLEDAYQKIGWEPPEEMVELTDMLAAHLIDEVQESGVKGVKYRHIAQVVKETLDGAVSTMVSNMSDEQLIGLVGQKRLRQLMQAEVQKVQRNLPGQVPRDVGVNRDEVGKFKKQEQIILHRSGDMKSFKKLLGG